MGDVGADTFPFTAFEFGDDAETCLLLLALLLRVGSKFKKEGRCCGDDGGVPSSTSPRLTLLLPVEIDITSAAAPHPICFGCSHAGIPLMVHSILSEIFTGYGVDIGCS